MKETNKEKAERKKKKEKFQRPHLVIKLLLSSFVLTCESPRKREREREREEEKKKSANKQMSVDDENALDDDDDDFGDRTLGKQKKL